MYLFTHDTILKHIDSLSEYLVLFKINHIVHFSPFIEVTFGAKRQLVENSID